MGAKVVPLASFVGIADYEEVYTPREPREGCCKKTARVVGKVVAGLTAVCVKGVVVGFCAATALSEGLAWVPQETLPEVHLKFALGMAKAVGPAIGTYVASKGLFRFFSEKTVDPQVSIAAHACHMIK